MSLCSLIKMLYCIFQKNGCKNLTMNQLQHCLKRNFGGKTDVNEIVDTFLENISAKFIRTEEITIDNVCSYKL